MAEEEAKKVEIEKPAEPAVAAEAPKDVAEEKLAIVSLAPEEEIDKPDDSKALAIVESHGFGPLNQPLILGQEAPEPVENKGSIDRDAALARVSTAKRLSIVKAWEESEKSKAENKAQKKLAEILAWENSKKASLEAEIKKNEEQMVKKKAEYIEKIKNKIALLHKSAEEKRAIHEAKRGEDLLKAEEIAAKCRATGTSPKTPLLGCF